MSYPKLPGLAPDGVIYANERMGTLEALLPTGGYPTAHAPALLELPGGTGLPLPPMEGQLLRQTPESTWQILLKT